MSIVLVKEVGKMLARLSFVKWDRFTNTDKETNIFGWIEREEDNYKDFVVLSYFKLSNDWWYQTSSSFYSEKIHKIVFGTVKGHNNCERVENWFDIPNMVRL